MPPPLSKKNPYESILKAVETKSLTVEKLIHYLNKYYDQDGVRDFLMNQLYDMNNKDAIFYIPELV